MNQLRQTPIEAFLFTPVSVILESVVLDFFMIFGRTELLTGASKAKFDARADVGVRSAVAPRKRLEKMIFRSQNFFDKQKFPVDFLFDLELTETYFGRGSRI